MRVGIIGASGYTGGELLRILLFHPKVEITNATSREYAGEHVYRVHPNLRGVTSMQFDTPDLSKTIEKTDLVMISTPHGVSSKLVPQLLENGVRVVDLGADFRLSNLEDYPKWYGWNHPEPELLKKAVYGVPEIHRENIRNAQLVACPGCTALSAILAIAPSAKAGLIEENRLVVDIKIGSSGAGGKPSRSSHHSERFGVVRPYKPVAHRHTAEIEQEIGNLCAQQPVRVGISAHAVNMVRGILCTVHSFLRKRVEISEVWKTYRSFYESEPFIRLVRDRKGLYRYPDPKVVVGSNFCDIGFELDEHVGRLVTLSAIDNLVKGAAGVAVQNMNLILGFEETMGLLHPGLHPV